MIGHQISNTASKHDGNNWHSFLGISIRMLSFLGISIPMNKIHN